ncbi:LacI family DNA-binding transcriptional regulator [Arthrobacter sp. RAF14]|uniref:LacI family DNA-binding transcriptional regulator n=1 Tax=Arthrobacter sp. RAF14 TaxID=3233051 RepID=UPI003F8F22F0
MTSGRPTVYDVAERAGVSIATVSFAFRKPDKVAAKTRKSVLLAAQELGYLPSGAARGLASGRTGVLGLHLFDLAATKGTSTGTAPSRTGRPEPDAFPIFDDEVQHGFVAECRENGVAALLSSGGPALADVVDTAGRVDGLAVLPTKTALDTLATVSSTIPVVMISSHGGEGHRVLVDNAEGERKLVEHMVQEHQVSSLGWVGPDDIDDFADRKDAFLRTVASLLTPDAAELLDSEPITSTKRFRSVLARARAGTLPDAIVCANDIFAIALIDELNAHGFSVPHDVRVVGFDGLLAGRFSTPPLTTVRQPMELIGRTAARLLLTDPRDGTGTAQTRILPVELQIGQSCGCPA